MNRAVVLLATITTLGITSTTIVDASERTSEQYAQLLAKAWAAWACTALADVADQDQDQARLFQLGYEAGKEGLTAIRDGLVEDQHIRSHVPIGWKLTAGGPTVDFGLGQAFEHIVGETLDPLYEETIVPEASFTASEPLLKAEAANRYRKANCSLIQ